MMARLRTSFRVGRAAGSAVAGESREGEAVLMAGARHTWPGARAQGGAGNGGGAGGCGPGAWSRVRDDPGGGEGARTGEDQVAVVVADLVDQRPGQRLPFRADGQLEADGLYRQHL